MTRATTNAGEGALAGTKASHDPFQIAADNAAAVEMAAYDSLPAPLRRALDLARGEFSAKQAADLIAAGHQTADQITANFMADIRRHDALITRNPKRKRRI